MAVSQHHSNNKKKIKRYTIFKDVKNNDFFNIKDHKIFKSYKEAIKNGAIFNFDISTNTGFFVRFDESFK